MTQTSQEIVDFVFSDRYLKLTILPTEKCNFRCEYCYEDFIHGKMSSDTVTGIKNLIGLRSPTLSLLELSWFGGEPLLASEIILDIAKFSKNMASTYQNLQFVSGVTTNGYLLTVPLMEQLVSNGVTGFQISIDGPREFHDKTRKLANGKGSYDHLMQNLINLRDSDLQFSIALRLHVTPLNVGHMPDFVSELATTFNDDRFSIIFQAVEHLGGPNDKNFDTIHLERSQILDRLYDIVSKQSSYIRTRTVGDNYVCYASRANAFVIRSTGNIGKCTVALNDDRNVVGAITVDGRVRLNAEKIKPWLRGIETLDFTVLGCPAVGFIGAPENISA